MTSYVLYTAGPDCVEDRARAPARCRCASALFDVNLFYFMISKNKQQQNTPGGLGLPVITCYPRGGTACLVNQLVSGRRSVDALPFGALVSDSFDTAVYPMKNYALAGHNQPQTNYPALASWPKVNPSLAALRPVQFSRRAWSWCVGIG